MTREIPSVVPLKDHLRENPAQALDLTALFALARRMHECGVATALSTPRISCSRSRRRIPHGSTSSTSRTVAVLRSVVGTRPAEYDLLDMLRSIERVMPITDRARWVEGYGLGADGTARLLAKLAGHRLERPWRHIRRAETDTREFLARISQPVSDGRG